MTQSEFTAFYPQFAGFTPAIVLSTYIAQANTCPDSAGVYRAGEQPAPCTDGRHDLLFPFAGVCG